MAITASILGAQIGAIPAAFRTYSKTSREITDCGHNLKKHMVAPE